MDRKKVSEERPSWSATELTIAAEAEAWGPDKSVDGRRIDRTKYAAAARRERGIGSRT